MLRLRNEDEDDDDDEEHLIDEGFKSASLKLDDFGPNKYVRSGSLLATRGSLPAMAVIATTCLSLCRCSH